MVVVEKADIRAEEAIVADRDFFPACDDAVSVENDAVAYFKLASLALDMGVGVNAERTDGDTGAFSDFYFCIGPDYLAFRPDIEFFPVSKL